MASTEEEVTDVLAAGVVSLTKGTNLFCGPEKPPVNGVPEKAVFVIGTGGQPPVSSCRNGAGNSLGFRGVQVIVRSARQGTTDVFSDGRDLAYDCIDAMNNATTSSGLAYGVILQQSSPILIGKNNQGNYRWSINAIVHQEF